MLEDRAKTSSGKIPVQVRLAPDVYLRAKTMADVRGVSVPTYIAWVTAEASMASQQVSDAIANLPSALLNNGPYGVEDAK